jgi:hydroxymethylglutaryl-CoA lyase
MLERVTIFEVGPRDGLQNEARMIATRDKIELVDLLTACGLKKIEVSSFVSPAAVPQMADAAEVFAGIKRRPGVCYAALTPNLRGYRAAKAAGAGEVAIFASASEGFSRKNINCSIAESFERFAPVMDAARADGMPVRGYVSCVVQCPYDGPVDPQSATTVATRLIDLGCYEISLGDTIGAATPTTVGALLDAVLGQIPAPRLAGHFHDTHGRALDNIALCLERGLRVFDASVAGLGGCPFAPSAPGNVDTGSVVRLLEKRAFATGIDQAKLAEAAKFAASLRSSA